LRTKVKVGDHNIKVK